MLRLRAENSLPLWLCVANSQLSSENDSLGNLAIALDLPYPCFPMKDLIMLFLHLLATIARLLGPAGAQADVADSLLMKQQFLIVNRSRQLLPALL